MKKLLLVLAAVALVPALAHAQSAGSFTYGNTGGTHCVLNGQNGQITGGSICASGADCTALGCSPLGVTTGSACTVNADCGTKATCNNPTGGQNAGTCSTEGVCGGSIVAGIKTNSGSGNVFDVRPSAVIGLLTDVSLQKNATVDVGTSSAYAGVDFTLAVTPPGGPGAPQPCISPDFSVTYAARFVQISSNLFTVLGNLCTQTGTNSVGGTTTSTGCFITFDESTVSAHSFDWIVGYPDANATANGNSASCTTLTSGVYGIAANWQASLGNTGISEALTCVGPVNLTVTQNKIFNFNQVN